MEAMDTKADALKLVESIADDACSNLFAAYGVPLKSVAIDGAPTAPVLLSSVIGFSGPGIRGTCLLAASESPIKMSDPTGGSVRAWIAELSNQLVGRIKNRLLSHGAEVYVTTPVVLRGEHLAPVPCNELIPRAFAASDGNVFVWIELETDPGLLLSAVPQDVTLAAAEGDALMF